MCVAVGDVVSGLVSVAAGGVLDIRPAAGVEWVIHNIYHAFDVDLAFTDGTNVLIFDTDVGAGVYAKYAFHATNTRWIRVINKDTTAARLIGYCGIQTK